MDTLDCPKCKKSKSIQLQFNKLKCQEEGCDFSEIFSCPICKSSLKEEQFNLISEEKGQQFKCTECQSSIPLKKISYIIKNNLYIDYEKKCDICEAPSLYRKENNLNHRCFFFPQCSGQTELFSQEKQALVFLDFETSGLEIGRDTIIEIGAVKIDTDGVESYFQELVKPNSPLNEQIQQLTGITNELLQDASSLNTALKNFISFCGTAKIIAHNAAFDIPWLLLSLKRHKLEMPLNDIVCTLIWAKNNKERGCSLGALTRRYNISHKNAHRALADCIATKELFLIFENKKITDAPHIPISDFQNKINSLFDRYADFFQP
tara:strand:+ start:370 stop:1329 length:960 start_codon:yes stop_codon:yes gene_type:complete